MGTAQLRVRSIAHRVCLCGYMYSRAEFEAMPRRTVIVDGTLHEVRSCVSCDTDMNRVVRLRPVDDVD